jgi:hypothetical protein
MRVKEAFYHRFKEGTLARINGVPGGDRYYCKCVDERVSPTQQLVFAEDLTPITMQLQKIVITTDGKTTTATLYEGKQRKSEAKATCSPADTFDLAKGAKLALDRLLGVEPEKPKMFPLEDSKAGYLLEVDRHGKRYYMTVTMGRYTYPVTETGLICTCPKKEWWAMRCWEPDLTYDEDAIVAVYGYALPSDALNNDTECRELLWRRSE